MNKSLPSDLILNAFKRAVTMLQPPPSLLIHTDRSSYYFDYYPTLLQRVATALRSKPNATTFST